MKFFHTADWHLGKLVQGVYMTDEQRYILKAVHRGGERGKAGRCCHCGRFIRPSGSADRSVSLLDDVLGEIVMELGVPVLAIGGNHDSPGRLILEVGSCRKTGILSLDK